MNKKNIRIGIIGAGGIVKSRHMAGFANISKATILGVCNRTQASSEKFAKEYSISKIFATPEELINSSEIDAVIIGTWPYKHCEYTIKSLEANKHVFVQARMAMNSDEAQRMLDTSKKYPHLSTMVCPSPFGFGADLNIRKLMAERYVGDVLTVRYVNLNKYNPTTSLSWRHLQEFSGMNILGVGIYYETISRWVGPAIEVMAYKSLNVKERVDTQSGKLSKVDIEDDVLIIGKLKNGGSFNYQFGLATHQPSERLEIFGKEGSIVYDLEKDQLFLAKANAELKLATIEPSLKKEWEVEKNFIKQIETGIQQEASFEEGLAYMKFTQAVHESFAKKTLITI